ncbi:MAG: CoA pyrophosphatase [Gammaproteobacteria bacterium]|nr:MAG: CoA pyrophosphatase [Gammaproteobacteria bacterium]
MKNKEVLTARLHTICDPLPQPTNRCGLAAALLAIVPDSLDQHIILTRRALHLRHHPGQMSFPGGVVEDGETLLATALRESEEEIGLSREFVHTIGALPPIKTTSGFELHTIVALVEGLPILTASPDEVHEIVRFPLKKALGRQYWHSEIFYYRGQKLSFEVCWHAGNLIWGATARVIAELRHRWHRAWPDQ